MRIFILITQGNIGGAQMSVLNMAQGMKSRGVDITVGFGQGNFLSTKLDSSLIPFVNFKYLQRTHNPLSNLFFIHELKKYLDGHQFDVVHINSSNALAGALAAKWSKNKPKTVFTHRGLTLLDQNYKKNNLFKYLYRLYFKFFLCFINEQIFVSQQNLNYAQQNHIVKHGTLIYNGLNPAQLRFYSKDIARQKLSSLLFNRQSAIGNRQFLIGSIGRLDYAKNYEFLINIFPEILKIKKGAVCVIIGEGAERKKYENLIAKLNLRKHIILTGEIKNANQYLPAFDLFILPSRYEGLSITMIETLFAGVPILASAVGGNPEMLNNSKHQLYELNDEKKFLDKFKDIVSNEKLRDQLVKNNKTLADKFHIDKTVGKYLKIYKKQ